MDQVTEEKSGAAVPDKAFAAVSGVLVLGSIMGASFLMFDSSVNAETYAGLKTVVVEEGVTVESPRLALSDNFSIEVAAMLADTKTKALKSSKTVYGDLDKTVEMTFKNKTAKFEVYKKDSNLTFIGNGYGVIEGAKDRESVYSIGMIDDDAMKKWLQNKSANEDIWLLFKLM